MSDFERQGWRQGSVLSAELAQNLLGSKALGDGGLAVIVSQDCDVTNANLDTEPTFEVLVARPVEEHNGGLWLGKHPRRLQFNTTEGEFETSIHDRHVLDRGPLRDARPADTKLDEESLRVLGPWVARRYDRAAFPTTYNNRLRVREVQINRALKRCKLISAVFVQTSFAELGDGEEYVVRILGAIRKDDDSSEHRETATKALDQLCSHIEQCDGIAVEDHELLSESEISLDDLRYIRRLEVGYLSERATPPDPAAPR